MNLKRLMPLLCTLALTITACTPFSFFNRTTVSTEPHPTVSDGDPAPAPTGRSMRDVAVFYTEHEPGYPDSSDALSLHHDNMSSLIGFWYQVDPVTFTVRSVYPPEVVAASVARAKAYGLHTEMLVYNFLYGSTRTSTAVLETLLTDSAAQDTFVASLVDTALQLEYDGVSIDFEHLKPSRRDAFSRLIERVAEAARAAGLSVSISVGAKTWDDPANGWAGGYDYARLGNAVDRLIVMTYDEHGYSSGPGPIASIGWVERVVRYVTSQVPSDKVLLGIAGYGFDWNRAGGRPRYLSHGQVEALRQRVGAPLRWDAEANTPYFTYYDAHGNLHEVWFENADSTSWKLDLVDKCNLGGIALWRLGLEDPALWDVVGQKFVPVSRM